MEKTYSIGELVDILNINKETVRYYEKIGLLSKPDKNDSGYRMYSKEDIDKIIFILIVKSLGFTLREIKTIISIIYENIYCKDAKYIKNIVLNKMSEIDEKAGELEKTKELLGRVKNSLDVNKCEDFQEALNNFNIQFYEK